MAEQILEEETLVNSKDIEFTMRIYGRNSQELPIIQRQEEPFTNSSINILQPYHTVQPSKIAVRVTNEIEIDTFIWAERYSDILSRIHLLPNGDAILWSKIAVRATNIVEGKAHIEGLESSDLHSFIHTNIYKASDLVSRFLIRIKNYLIGEVGIFANDESQISSIIIVVQKPDKDLLSQISVRYRNKMTGYSFIYGYHESCIDCSIIVKQKSQLKCSINVGPDTIMIGIVDIQPPERIKESISVVKDAFVREGIPKLNYGTEQLLMVGYSAGKDEVFQSILNFDISPIVNLNYCYKLEKVLLKLNFSPHREPDIPLSVNQLTGDWEELGITWNNKPEIGELLTDMYQIDFEESRIIFDITHSILQAETENRKSYSVYLKALNESDDAIRLYSREAGEGYEPIIQYTYFDDIIRSTGRSNIDTTLNIVYRGNGNLLSKLNVKSYWNHRDLPSSIWAIQPGERESKLMISRRFIYSSLTARASTDNDIQAFIAIREANLNDLENCFGHISRKFMQTSLYVKHRYEMPSQLGVRVWDQSEMFSWGMVSIKLRPASIYVIPYYDWQGIIAIRRADTYDIKTSMIISERVRPASVEILHRSNLSGSIQTKQEEINDIPSLIISNSKQRPASIYVIPYFDFIGKITAKRKALSEIPASILTSCPDLVGRTYIRFQEDIKCYVAIKRSSLREIPASMVTSCPDFKVSVYTRFREDMKSDASIRRNTESDIAVYIAPSFPDVASRINPRLNSDINGTLTIRKSEIYYWDSKIYVLNRISIPMIINVIGASKLQSSLRVTSGWLRSTISVLSQVINSEISSLINIRQKLISDNPSKIRVIYVSWLPCSINTKQQSYSSIEGSITVKRHENSDICTSIDVWIIGDTRCSLSVRLSADNQIYSSLEVLNHYDALFALYIRPYESILGEIDVRYRSYIDMNSTIVAKIRDIGDLPTAIEILFGGRRDIKARLSIAPENNMTGIVDVVPPIRSITPIALLKDAYIREDIPKLNYGGVQSLAIGRYNNTRLRTLLGFNIQEIPTNRVLDKVELKLYYPDGKKISKGLVICDVVDQWEEYGVTWENRPNIGNTISNDFCVNEEDNITFDITEFIASKYQKNNYEIDFYLTVEDEDFEYADYFYSRESLYPPVISVTHHSNIIWSSGRANLDSRIDLRHRGNRQLASKLNVFVYSDNSEISGQIAVNTQAFRRGLITINKPDVLSELKVQHSSYSAVVSNILVKIPGYEELSSELMISQLNLKASIYALEKINLVSTVTVRQKLDNDIFSWGFINCKERQASVYVAYHNQLFSKIKVNGKADQEINSMLSVIFPKILAKIVVSQTNRTKILSRITVRRKDQNSNIPTIIRVRQSKERNLSSKVRIIRREIAGYIRISEVIELHSSIKIYSEVESKDVQGSIIISKKVLPGRISVVRLFNLPSSISVAPIEFNYTSIKVGISRPDILAFIRILESEDLSGRIHIRGWEKSDYRLSLGINRPDLFARTDIYRPNNISASLMVRVTNRYDQILKLTINRPDLQSKLSVKGYMLLPSNIGIRHSSQSNAMMAFTVSRPDMSASIDVRIIMDIDSIITVSKSSSIEIFGSLEVLEKEDIRGHMEVWHITKIPSYIRVLSGNLKSLIGVIGYDKSEWLSTLGVRVPYKNDLLSYMEIITKWSLLNAKLIIRVSNLMEGTVNLIGYNEQELDCSLNLRIANDISSIIGITFKNKMTGIADFVPVGDVDIEGKVLISPASDIKGNITAIKYGDCNINCSTTIKANGRAIIGSKLDIVYRGNSSLISAIKITEDNMMTGKIFIIPVRDSDLDSSVVVHKISEFESRIIIRRERRSEIEANIYILHHRDLYSSIQPIIYYDIATKVTARRFSQKQITCSFTVRLKKVNQILGWIQPRYGFDTPSKIAIRRSACNTINSNVFVLYRSNLESRIYPIIHNDKSSLIAIRRKDDCDLTSSIHPIIHNDIYSNIIVRQRDSSTIFGSIIIRQCANYDIAVTIWPRYSFDILSSVIARQAECSNIDGNIIVRQIDDSNLLASISARRSADYNMHSIIWARYCDEIEADMYILYHNDLTCSIEAITAYPYAYIM